jgi:ABC-type uncharacterized transport system ATPase subunit
MEQAEKLCDYICLISNGRTVLTGDLATIKRRESGNSYRLVASGDVARIEQMPAVTQVLHRGAGEGSPGDGLTSLKVLLNPGVQGSDVLRELVQFLNVHEFRSEEPDLEEIFIKAVQDAA